MNTLVPMHAPSGAATTNGADNCLTQRPKPATSHLAQSQLYHLNNLPIAIDASSWRPCIAGFLPPGLSRRISMRSGAALLGGDLGGG